MMDERRWNDRDRSFARILIEVEGRVGYISDVSDRGFKGLFPEPFSETPGSGLLVRVSFEELGIPAFELHALLRWSRKSGGAGEVGFELEPGLTDRLALEGFMKIRDYYAGANLAST